MNVLMINDSTSNQNWGDRAAAISLKKMISASGGVIVGTVSEDELKQWNFRETPKTRQPHLAAKIFTQFVPPVFSKIAQRLSGRFSSTAGDDIVPLRWEDFDHHIKLLLGNGDRYAKLLNTIQLADMVVIHGDGCMVGNTRIARAELFLSYLIKKHLNKPVIIVNHTAEFDHPDLSKMARQVYPLFDDVVFRDAISAERCQTICAGRLAADTAFWFKPASREVWAPFAHRLTYFDVWPDIARFNPSQPYLCVGGSSAFSYEAKPVDIITDCSLLIKHIQSVYSGQIVLTASDVIDQEVFRPIAAQLHLPLIGLTTPVQQAVDILGNADAYVGGRWHPSIFALRGGTPIIPISSKTFKMRALAEMAGLPSGTFCASTLQHTKDSICEQILSHLQQGNELRNRLCKWAEDQAENSWDNVSYLINMNQKSI